MASGGAPLHIPDLQLPYCYLYCMLCEAHGPEVKISRCARGCIFTFCEIHRRSPHKCHPLHLIPPNDECSTYILNALSILKLPLNLGLQERGDSDSDEDEAIDDGQEFEIEGIQAELDQLLQKAHSHTLLVEYSVGLDPHAKEGFFSLRATARWITFNQLVRLSPKKEIDICIHNKEERSHLSAKAEMEDLGAVTVIQTERGWDLKFDRRIGEKLKRNQFWVPQLPQTRPSRPCNPQQSPFTNVVEAAHQLKKLRPDELVILVVPIATVTACFNPEKNEFIEPHEIRRLHLQELTDTIKDPSFYGAVSVKINPREEE